MFAHQYQSNNLPVNDSRQPTIVHYESQNTCGGAEASCRNQKKVANQHRFGAIHINYILYFFIPLLIFACYYSYHMSVKQKQEKPFPHATITNTACHYPQDTVFRFLMLPAGSFIVLIYFIAFRWLQLLKKKTGYPYGVQSWLYKWAVASVIGFYCAIGTIDSAGYPAIHGIGAVFFFVVLFLTAAIITLVVRELHNWDPTIATGFSVNLKIIIVGYILGTAIYSLFGSITEIIPSNDDDIYLVIIEWNLTIGGLIWLLTFVFDWKHIYLTLNGDFSKTFKLIQQ